MNIRMICRSFFVGFAAIVLLPWFSYLSQVHAADFQPSSPYYTTFFYPWYENPTTDGKWSQWSDPPNGSSIGHTPPQNWFSHYLPDPNPSVFDPAHELYSSNDDQIIYWQLRKLAEAKQEVAIASWWGQTHKTNISIRKILTDIMKRSDNPYPNLRWGIYYEKEGFGDPAVDTELVPDLKYIVANYTNQPAYFKINGLPVVFVYNAAHTGYSPANDLLRWQQAKEKVKADTGVDLFIVLKRDPLDSGAAINAIDSWHEYAPAARTNTRSSLWFSVSPGFWLDGTAARLVRDPASFESGVKQMVAANVPWKITETWNEWGEGSGVEPADAVNQVNSGTATIKTGSPAFKNTYVDILNRNLPALEQGTGVGNVTPSPSLSAGPTTSVDPVIAAIGDMVCGAASTGAACKHMQTADLVLQMNPVWVLTLGDIQYEAGSASDFANFYQPSWGRLKAKTKPVVGNHEYGTPGAKGYYDYFNGVNIQNGQAGDRTKGYYSFDVGTWHIVVLNSNCAKAGGCKKGSPQEQWLIQDLATHPTACSILAMHHPLWVSQRGYENIELQPLFEDFYNAGGDVALVGHSHFYERFAPQTPLSYPFRIADPNGIREFVIGTGGRNTYLPDELDQLSEVRSNKSNIFGALKLTLHPNSYEWKFIEIPGQTASAITSDTGIGQCHGKPSSLSPFPSISGPQPSPASTRFAVSLLLHGIGSAGDNTSPGIGGNKNPLHPQRAVTIQVFDVNNIEVATRQGTVTYDAASGSFKGSVDMGPDLETELYTVSVQVDHYLRRKIPGIIQVTAGQSVSLPQTSLVTGDATADNSLNILDFNTVLDCFSDLSPAKNCSDTSKKAAADFTDDGSVNQFDYNLFLRELSVQSGQ